MSAKDETVLVTARRVANFREMGQTPPADALVTPCVNCGALVAISKGGAARMDAKRAEGARVAAICTPCMLLHVPKIQGVEMSEQGAALVERNPEVVKDSGIRAKDVLSELIRRTEK